MAMIAVTKTPATKIETGYLQVTAGSRSSKDPKTGKKIEVPADQKSRSIVIPEFKPNVSSKYATLVVNALASIARDQLAEMWKENPQIAEVEDKLFAEDALLTYSAKRAELARLSGDSIVAWWNQSQLKQVLLSEYSEAQVGRFVEEIKHIAAPTISWPEEVLLKRIATIGRCEEDLEDTICQQMIRRLQNRLDEIRKIREELIASESLPF